MIWIRAYRFNSWVHRLPPIGAVLRGKSYDLDLPIPSPPSTPLCATQSTPQQVSIWTRGWPPPEPRLPAGFYPSACISVDFQSTYRPSRTAWKNVVPKEFVDGRHRPGTSG